MLGGRVSKISSLAWEVINYQCGGMIFTSSFFIFYDDIILLLLPVFGRGQTIPWDPDSLWNEIFPKGVEKFGSLQSRKWDPGILISYLN